MTVFDQPFINSLSNIFHWAVEAVKGPKNIIFIGPEGTVTSSKISLLRPIVMRVDPSLILSHELSLPFEAKSDLQHAADLSVETETPFTRAEVLKSTSVQAARGEDILLSVNLLPRRFIPTAEQIKGFKPERVREITVAVTDKSTRIADFVSDYNSLAPWLKSAWILPLITFLTLANIQVLALSASAGRALLEQEVRADELRSDLRVMLDEIGRRESFASATATAALPVLSLTDAFGDVGRVLQDGLVVLRMDGRDGVLRLYVASPDPVEAAKAMDRDLLHWTASIDGPVQSEPDGRTTATIVLQRE